MLDDLFRHAGGVMHMDHGLDEYAERHGIAAAPFLTITSDSDAAAVVRRLSSRIEGKTVVEIGGGLGLVSLHMGGVAKRVFCIEANPLWASSFAKVLIAKKPKNVSYLFGAAQEFFGVIRADVAVFLTHSGVEDMLVVASHFAPEVIDVYGEIIADNPGRFDATAVLLRGVA